MTESKRRARTWREIRAEGIKSGRLTEEGLAAGKAKLVEAERAYRLAELRKEHGPRQVDLAAILGVSQAAVSKLERGDLSHTQLGTLIAYVNALGGNVRIVAEIGDQTLTLADGDRTSEHAA